MSVFIAAVSFAQDMKRPQQMTLAELSVAKGIRQEKLAELIVPDIDADLAKLPLEKINRSLTDEYIQTALDGYLQRRTLRDLAGDTEYPIKKLRNILGLDVGRSGYDKPLSDFGISPQRVSRAIRTYEEGESDFLWSITATGMIIVFIALIITGVVVALLELFHRMDIQQRLRRKTMAESEADTKVASRGKKRKRSAISRKITAADVLDAPTVAAIATAIRLHESSLEEANRILATWTKASVSMWKSNRTMPNLRFFDKRHGQ